MPTIFWQARECYCDKSDLFLEKLKIEVNKKLNASLVSFRNFLGDQFTLICTYVYNNLTICLMFFYVTEASFIVGDIEDFW